MALFGGDQGRIEVDQTRALAHPLRFRIWSMFREEPDRLLSAAELHADLNRADEFCDMSVSQVAYHVARLRDAQLIPTPARG
jgi:hypothetical protein